MLDGFITIGLLQLLAVISPGPDFFILLKNTLAYTRRAGFFTAVGITCGVMFHLSYCLLGLALIIKRSSVLFTTIKYLGAAYLIYLGIKNIFSRYQFSANNANVTDILLSNSQAFRQGLFCNLFNPKVSLFFLGLFTLVINPKTPISIQISYSLEIILITFSWFSFIAVALTHPLLHQRIKIFQQLVNKCMGALLIAFGVKLIFLKDH